MNFEDIKNKLSNLKPAQLGLLAGAVGIGIYIFYPRNNTFVEPGIVSNGGFTSAGLDGQPSGEGMVAGSDSTLAKIVSETQKAFEDNKLVTDSLNNSINSVNEDLNSSFNKISEEFTTYKRNSSKAVETIDTSFNTLQESAFDQAVNSIPSIYFDNKPDDVQFNSIYNAVGTSVKAKEIDTSQANKIISTIAGMGNNGVGYDPKASAESEKKISSDASYKASEIVRTNAVIENRLAKGEDITAQKNYLQKILKL